MLTPKRIDQLRLLKQKFISAPPLLKPKPSCSEPDVIVVDRHRETRELQHSEIWEPGTTNTGKLLLPNRGDVIHGPSGSVLVVETDYENCTFKSVSLSAAHDITFIDDNGEAHSLFEKTVKAHRPYSDDGLSKKRWKRRGTPRSLRHVQRKQLRRRFAVTNEVVGDNIDDDWDDERFLRDYIQDNT